MTPARRTRLPSRAVLAVAALPVLFGVVDVVQDTVFGLPSGIRLAPRMVPGVLAFYLVLAALTPVVHRVVSRSVSAELSGVGRLGIHLVAAPLFALAHLTITMVVQRGVVPHEPDIGRHFANMVRMFLMPGIMWYVVLAVSLHALLYSLRSQESELAAARLATGLAEARMSALDAQLAPHFLFNTLSTIGALAERGESERVIEVVHDLADLLRGVRREGSGSTHTVLREQELLEKYLRILDVRFGHRLQVDLRVQPAARAAEMPALTLQLLVENAVKHGYGARADGLRIEVEVRREGAWLRILVSDSGPGFAADDASAGVGLSNLRARLSALYGERYELETGTSPLGGAEVAVSLPWEIEAPPSLAGAAAGSPTAASPRVD